jgi:ribosome-associated protein
MDELSDSRAAQADLPEGPSKSQVKREMHALQELAERLVSLPREELEPLGLGEATWAAIEETPRIKDKRALRRHYKRIAKLLAKDEGEAVEALVNKKERMEREAAARHHRVERWRERLIADGDEALGDLLAECPRADRQRLRALTQAARRDRARGRADAPRRLFRALRDELARVAKDD